MYSIAVTGGIACGKSLFGHMLSDLGADVADADDIVRAMHLPGGKGASLVAEHFGSEFLTPDGGTDRQRLGDLIFRDTTARERLNALIHPVVKEALDVWKNAPTAAPFKTALIPLLFESGWENDWDTSVCIIAPEQHCVVRLCGRGLTETQALERISAHMTSAQKAQRAHIVIHNDATAADLRKTAARFASRIMEQLTQ